VPPFDGFSSDAELDAITRRVGNISGLPLRGFLATQYNNKLCGKSLACCVFAATLPVASLPKARLFFSTSQNAENLFQLQPHLPHDLLRLGEIVASVIAL
jgi:hypothetical protein